MNFFAGLFFLILSFAWTAAQTVRISGNAGYLTGGKESYRPENLVDNDLETWWTPGETYRNGPGALVNLNFTKPAWVYGFRIHPGSHHTDYPGYGNIFKLNNRIDEAKLVLTRDKDSVTIEMKFPDWDKVFFLNTSEFGIRFPETATLYIRSVREGSEWKDLCISEFKPVFEHNPGIVQELKPVSYTWWSQQSLPRDSVSISYRIEYEPASPSPFFRSSRIQVRKPGQPEYSFEFNPSHCYQDIESLGQQQVSGLIMSEGPRILFFEPGNKWLVFSADYRSGSEKMTTSSVFALDEKGKVTMLRFVPPCLKLESDAERKLIIFGNRRYDFRQKKWTLMLLKPMRLVENSLVKGHLVLFAEMPDSGTNVFLADPLTGELQAELRTDCFTGSQIRCAQWEVDEGSNRLLVCSAKEKRVYFVGLIPPYSVTSQIWDGVSKVGGD